MEHHTATDAELARSLAQKRQLGPIPDDVHSHIAPAIRKVVNRVKQEF